MKKLLAITAFLVILTGCLDIETRISIENDGSGRVRMRYNADPELIGFGAVGEDESELPVPFGEREFEQLARDTEGLELRSYDRSDRGERVVIDAELAFENLEALNAVYAGRRDYITLTERNGRLQYGQVILEDAVEEIGEETRAFATEFLSEYRLSFEVRAPSRILDHNLGELSSDGRTASYERTIAEYVTSEKTLTWQLEWDR